MPGLGTMRFGLRSKSVEKVEDVKTGLIKSRRIIFTPSVDLKEEQMKKRIVEVAVKMIVAALTAFLTAITTTSCLGHGPIYL